MLFRSSLSARPGRVFSGIFVLACGLAAGAVGCTTDDTTTTVTDEESSTTAVLLRPAYFLGDTPCSTAPGALRSYVATLIDRTDPLLPFTLASSLPTPCSQGVRFDHIVGGHLYSAQIDGYEAFADELCTVGCFNSDGTLNYTALRSGNRHMEHPDGTPATPRWAGSCGEHGTEPTFARLDGTTLVLDCDPMVDGAAGSTTAVVIDPRDALGSLACAASAPQDQTGVASFDIEAGGALGNVLGAPCNDLDPFVLTYSAGLVPGTTVDIFVGAHATAGGPLTWGATCSALVKAGLTVRAACAPLSAKGSLRVDIVALLAQFGVSCSGDIVSYDATLAGPSVEVEKVGVSCNNQLSFGPLAPGAYTADLVVHTKDGGTLFSAACSAEVEPGRDANAVCSLQ